MGYVLKQGCAQTCVPLSNLAHKTLAIDAMNCLYGMARKHGGSVPKHFDALCCALQRNKVNSLLVFDGAPDADRIQVREVRAIERRKREREHERRRTLTGPANARALSRLAYQLAAPSHGDIQRVLEIAKSRNMASYFCEGEADGVCARIARDSLGGAAASTDTDILVFGAPMLVYDICPETDTYSVLRLRTVLECLCATVPQFREVCALAGTDKAPTIAPLRTLLPITGGPDVSIISEYENRVGYELTRTRNAADAYAHA